MCTCIIIINFLNTVPKTCFKCVVVWLSIGLVKHKLHSLFLHSFKSFQICHKEKYVKIIVTEHVCVKIPNPIPSSASSVIYLIYLCGTFENIL